MKLDQRTMRRFLLFVCIIVSFCVSVILASAKSLQTDDEVHDVEINEYNFPDYLFREYVHSSFDENSDGILSAEELRKVKKIIIADADIESIVGIRKFVELETLVVMCTPPSSGDYTYRISNYDSLSEVVESKLTGIDVSGMENLRTIVCDFSPNIRYLRIDGCKALSTLYCPCTAITELDLSGLSQLREVDCGNEIFFDGKRKERQNSDTAPITKLILKNNTNLGTLWCNGNELDELDLRDCNNLRDLDCSNNKLTELDVRNCKDLYELNCSRNKLTKLDISHLRSLENVNCRRNRLTEFTAKDTKIKGVLDCRENDLDEVDLSATGIGKDNCYFDKGVKVDYGTSFLRIFFIVIGAIVLVGIVVSTIKKIKKNRELKRRASNFEMPEWYKKE